MSTCVCAKCKEPWEASGSPARCPHCGQVSFAIAVQSASSVAIKKLWQDPEYRASMSAAIKKHWQDPEYRAKQSAAMKKHWQDPEYRAHHSAAMKEHWEDPEFRAKQSLLIKVNIPQPRPGQKYLWHLQGGTIKRGGKK